MNFKVLLKALSQFFHHEQLMLWDSGTDAQLFCVTTQIIKRWLEIIGRKSLLPNVIEINHLVDWRSRVCDVQY